MDTKVEKTNGTARVRLEGELNIYSAVDLKKSLLDNLDDAGALDLDLSNVTEMDTSGFQLLLLAKREAGISGKAFNISSHSSATAGMLELYNMKGYFESKER